MIALILFIFLISLSYGFKDQQIKTSIINPLFLVRPPSAEGVAIANEFIVQIYLREKLYSSFDIPSSKYHFSDDVVFKAASASPLKYDDKRLIIQNLQEHERVSRSNTPVYSYHLKKHIISDEPIRGLYWGFKHFFIQTLSALQIYTQELNFIMNYKLNSSLLTMTSIGSNVYLLFEDPSNKYRLYQVTINFDKNNNIRQNSFLIELPQSYRIYEYFMNDYEWLYLVNETHVQVYDILNQKMRNTIQSKFGHPITNFRVDESDSLAIASNQFGDYLFISFNHVLLQVRNTSYTFATFCSSEYVVIGNNQQFQVMKVNQNYLSSEAEFQTEDIKAIACNFDEDLNIIYTIDQSGYLGIYFDTKTKWMILVVVLIIIFVVIFFAKLLGDYHVKEFQRVKLQQKLLQNQKS